MLNLECKLAFEKRESSNGWPHSKIFQNCIRLIECLEKQVKIQMYPILFYQIQYGQNCRAVQDTFEKYLDTDTFSKKYLDTDTFKILSKKCI